MADPRTEVADRLAGRVAVVIGAGSMVGVSKGGLVPLTHVTAHDEAANGVRVNLIAMAAMMPLGSTDPEPIEVVASARTTLLHATPWRAWQRPMTSRQRRCSSRRASRRTSPASCCRSTEGAQRSHRAPRPDDHRDDREPPTRFGLTAFCTEDSLSPHVLAPLVEDAGFHLLLFPDHTHVPVDGASRFPGGGGLPDHYRRTYDPLVCCALAAATTTELRVGVGVALVPVRDPIILAKEVASIDQASRGRMVLGVGAGWNSAEIENHGVAAGDRWALMREHVLAMKTIWTDEIATFEGCHVRIAPLWSWPKPYQRPHPPIAVGGSGPGVLGRVVDYGDEWLAMTGPGLPSVSRRLRLLTEMAERAGRPRPAVTVQVYGDPPDEQVIERYIRLGVDRIDLTLPYGDADDTRRPVAALAGIVARWSAD